MNWIDAAIVIVFIYFIITAFTAGFLRETIGIGSAILGVVLAGLFYDEVADTLLSSIDNATTSSVVAFLIILFGVTLAGQGLAMLLKPAVTVMQLGIFDQLMGAAIGAVKAFVLVEVLLILFVTYPRFDLDTRIRDSEFASKMLQAAPPMLKVLPGVFDSKVDQFNGN